MVDNPEGPLKSSRHSPETLQPRVLVFTMMDRLELPDVTVDFRREEVRGRDGARKELRPRSFAVLRRLAAKAGELATKDELLCDR